MPLLPLSVFLSLVYIRELRSDYKICSLSSVSLIESDYFKKNSYVIVWVSSLNPKQKTF